jgi:hypothetical protein
VFVCVLFLDLFQDDLKCWFSLHHSVTVTSGQSWWCPKGSSTSQSVHKSHTTEESVRRRRSGRHSAARYCLAIRAIPGSYVLTLAKELDAPTCHEKSRATR